MNYTMPDNSPFGRKIADMRLGLALESGYYKVADGYLPGYSGWDSEVRNFLFCVTNTNTWVEEFALTLRVPDKKPHLYVACEYRALRQQFRSDGILDGSRIRRRLELSVFDPLAFLAIANQWFSELADEAAAATTHYTQEELPMAPRCGVDIGRSHTRNLAAPVYTKSSLTPTRTGVKWQ